MIAGDDDDDTTTTTTTMTMMMMMLMMMIVVRLVEILKKNQLFTKMAMCDAVGCSIKGMTTCLG